MEWILLVLAYGLLVWGAISYEKRLKGCREKSTKILKGSVCVSEVTGVQNTLVTAVGAGSVVGRIKSYYPGSRMAVVSFFTSARGGCDRIVPMNAITSMRCVVRKMEVF